jgi:hypothetical protein
MSSQRPRPAGRPGTADDVRVGQEVRVLQVGIMYSEGAPPGGWPGHIVRVTPKQVHITYGDRPLTDIFDRASQRIRYGDVPRKFRTLPQLEDDARRAAAMRVLRGAGIRLEGPSRLTTGQVEALAEVARTFREDEEGA